MDLYLRNKEDFSGICDRFWLDSWETVMHTIKRQITGRLALFDINEKLIEKLGPGGEGGGWLWDGLKRKHYHDLSICIKSSLQLYKHFVLIEVYTHAPVPYSPAPIAYFRLRHFTTEK